jgi:hypothetical protein
VVEFVGVISPPDLETLSTDSTTPTLVSVDMDASRNFPYSRPDPEFVQTSLLALATHHCKRGVSSSRSFTTVLSHHRCREG